MNNLLASFLIFLDALAFVLGLSFIFYPNFYLYFSYAISVLFIFFSISSLIITIISRRIYVITGALLSIPIAVLIYLYTEPAGKIITWFLFVIIWFYTLGISFILISKLTKNIKKYSFRKNIIPNFSLIIVISFLISTMIATVYLLFITPSLVAIIFGYYILIHSILLCLGLIYVIIKNIKEKRSY